MINNFIENTIDVVIPVYNGESFILNAIESATNQTLPPFQIIVVDDGSTDTTNKIVSTYAQNSKVTIILINKKNGGLSSARNAGIQACTSSFVAFLDADDIWLPTKLEKQMNAFSTSDLPNLALIYCRHNFIKIDGSKDSESYVVPLDKAVRGNAFYKILESNKILSSSSGVLIKRIVFENVGFFDEKLKYAEDWDMWIRISEKFQVDYIDEVLVSIRNHPDSMSKDKTAGLIGEIEFFNKWSPLISRSVGIPAVWTDMVLGRAIKRLPKLDFFRIIKQKMRPETYERFFEKTSKSLIVCSGYFLVRKIVEKYKN